MAKQKMNGVLTRLTFFAYVIVVSPSTVAAAEIEIWDPGAITVNPSHEYAVSSATARRRMLDAGKRLFTAKFNRIDGAGRPASTGDSKPTSRLQMDTARFTRLSGPDAMSCHACHNQPGIGGSGDFVANAFVGAHFSTTPESSISPQRTSERNTISIAGSGLVEIAAREITADLQSKRDSALRVAIETDSVVEAELRSKGIDFGKLVIRPDTTIDFSGLLGIDYDLVVRPFGVKGIAASLREFTIAALNQHHGIQATERFGWERTGTDDFDEDGVKDEFSIGQVSALVLFQAALPPPTPRTSFANLKQSRLRETGKSVFGLVGCSSCHIPFVEIETLRFTEPSAHNRPGAISAESSVGVIEILLTDYYPIETVGVEAFTDFKRHNLCDDQITHFCNEKLRQDNVPQNLFLTSKLWDLATSAPYGHRGDLGSISEAILAHGGEARETRERFLALDLASKRALIAYLSSLGSESDGR